VFVQLLLDEEEHRSSSQGSTAGELRVALPQHKRLVHTQFQAATILRSLGSHVEVQEYIEDGRLTVYVLGKGFAERRLRCRLEFEETEAQDLEREFARRVVLEAYNKNLFLSLRKPEELGAWSFRSAFGAVASQDVVIMPAGFDPKNQTEREKGKDKVYKITHPSRLSTSSRGTRPAPTATATSGEYQPSTSGSKWGNTIVPANVFNRLGEQLRSREDRAKCALIRQQQLSERPPEPWLPPSPVSMPSQGQPSPTGQPDPQGLMRELAATLSQEMRRQFRELASGGQGEDQSQSLELQALRRENASLREALARTQRERGDLQRRTVAQAATVVKLRHALTAALAPTEPQPYTSGETRAAGTSRADEAWSAFEQQAWQARQGQGGDPGPVSYPEFMSYVQAEETPEQAHPQEQHPDEQVPAAAHAPREHHGPPAQQHQQLWHQAGAYRHYANRQRSPIKYGNGGGHEDGDGKPPSKKKK